jgi:prepilin-type N-terminal cleavage/methylation domain-containing protein
LTRAIQSSRGFTLVELLIASSISVAVIAVSCQLAVDLHAAWRSASARVDLQQRTRVAADLVSRALREAGAGPLSGPARGTLMRGVPPIVPRRTGRRGAHTVDDFRDDAFSVLRAVAEAEHGVLFVAAAPGAPALELAPGTGCTLPACGFAAGSSVMLLDQSGQHDVFTVTAVDGLVLGVRRHGSSPSAAYAAGTPVLAVESQSFSFDPQARTMRVYDGDASDLPLLDDVVGVRVRYWGETAPPVWPRPAAGEANCLYAADGSYHSALMPALGAAGRLFELSPSMLTDGPWCGSGDRRFDADLLRVRRIRISLRFQASDPAVRGAGVRFANPGLARREAVMVPDRNVEIDVTPRNLRLE